MCLLLANKNIQVSIVTIIVIITIIIIIIISYRFLNVKVFPVVLSNSEWFSFTVQF